MGKLEILAEALHEEKDVNVHTRILAVRLVMLGNSTASVATAVDATQRTIQLWLVRFNEDGIKGLYPVTGRGRRLKVSYARVGKLAIRLCNKAMLTPKKLPYQIQSLSSRGPYECSFLSQTMRLDVPSVYTFAA